MPILEALIRFESGAKAVRGGRELSFEVEWETTVAESGLIFLRDLTVLTTRES